MQQAIKIQEMRWKYEVDASSHEICFPVEQDVTLPTVARPSFPPLATKYNYRVHEVCSILPTKQPPIPSFNRKAMHPYLAWACAGCETPLSNRPHFHCERNMNKEGYEWMDGRPIHLHFFAPIHFCCDQIPHFLIQKLRCIFSPLNKQIGKYYYILPRRMREELWLSKIERP